MQSGNFYKILVNIKEWYNGLEDSATGTYGNLCLYIVDVLQNAGINCVYIETVYNSSTSYPGIRFPWVDGTLSTNASPVVFFEKDKSTLITSTSKVHFGVSNGESYKSCEYSQIVTWSGSHVSSESGTAVNFTTRQLTFLIDTRTMINDGYYTIAVAHSNTNLIDRSSGDISDIDAMNTARFCYVTTVTDRESDDTYNGMITVGTGTSGALDLYVVQNSTIIECSRGVPFDGASAYDDVVHLYKLIFGRYESDFYTSNKSVFTILKNYTSTDFLLQNKHIMEKAIVIDDIAYDVAVNARDSVILFRSKS